MVSKDNKLYTKVLVELDKTHKLTSLSGHYNNLVTIMHTTEDEELRGLIGAYIEFLPKIEKYAKAKMSINTQSLVNDSKPYKVDLYNYCGQMVKLCKPEWQIIAERNGWRKD